MPMLNGQSTDAPQRGEQTKRQVHQSGTVVVSGNPFNQMNVLAGKPTYATYRKMRKHPTIALGRALASAPVVAADWSIESDDDVDGSITSFIQDQFHPIREGFVQAAMNGGIDFGWQPWEKVFETDIVDGRQRLVIRKFKPLIQDNTDILTDEQGRFLGFRQGDLTLDVANCLLIPFRVEGTQWDGYPLLENARETWNQWRDANDGAARYDRKIAGSHFIVYYPDGKSEDASGAVRANHEIAQSIIHALESSGSVAIPTIMTDYVDNLNQQVSGLAWKIEILEDRGGRQPTFIERLNYLDKLLVRALLLPERAAMEGEHGTKAEAGEHIDLAMTVAELTHRHITRHVNWYAVDQLLALNWGDEMRGKVRLVASPIVDTKMAFLREVYQAVLQSPSGFVAEFGTMDTDSIKDLLGVPKAEEIATGDDPLEGVDPNDPRAEIIRRVMREQQQENNNATGTDD